ncbi:S1 family peptidase [Micromonospora zhanjiangensis]|uniref:S1 family peptidase n=1 Tax=Micromonospora zhanjiangensis TaxID=1522057 RepID=A0ABV8KP24_9ACTN
MDKRRVILTAAVVATVGGAAALTLPSFAGTQKDRPPAQTSGPKVSPLMLNALARDLHLTPEQAQQRLRQDAQFIRTAQTLKSQVGAAWAGAWVDKTGKTLNVAVTDARKTDTISKMGARPMVVKRSAVQLNKVKLALDSRAAQAKSSVTGWFVDPASNQVVVLSRSTPAARALMTAAGVDTDMVRVVATKGQPRLLAGPTAPAGAGESADDGRGGAADKGQAGNAGNGQAGNGNGQAGNGQAVRGGLPYIINGQARCSVGFAVEGGFLSAGHCGQQGDTTAALSGGALRNQGVFVESTFPENDFSFVKTEAAFTPVAEVESFNGQTRPVEGGQPLPVAGSTEAPVGTAVCKFGSTTGASCGTVQALNATVQFADPAGGAGTVTVNGLTQTDACAEGGDSGGPFLAGDQAQGTVSGGNGDCTVGGTTFFQPVNAALQTLKLTLLTSGGGDAGAGAGDAGAGSADPGAGSAGAVTQPGTANRGHR